jgi:hypothetical protein
MDGPFLHDRLIAAFVVEAAAAYFETVEPLFCAFSGSCVGVMSEQTGPTSTHACGRLLAVVTNEQSPSNV